MIKNYNKDIKHNCKIFHSRYFDLIKFRMFKFDLEVSNHSKVKNTETIYYLGSQHLFLSFFNLVHNSEII